MHRFAWLTPVLVALGLFAADLNEELLSAARKGDLAVVRQMLDKGAALEAKTSYGQTPLYVAAMNGNEDVVRFLLEKGANPNVIDTFYKMPLLVFVISRQHVGTIKLLLEKGATAPDQILSEMLATGTPDLVQTILNSSKPNQAVLDSAYERALQTPGKEVADMLKKAGAREPAPAVKVDSATLESYAGTYKSEGIPLDIKAFVRDGVLYMQATGQGEFPLKPRSPSLFEFAPAQVVVEFSSSSSFTLKQGVGSYVFKKAVTQ